MSLEYDTNETNSISIDSPGKIYRSRENSSVNSNMKSCETPLARRVQTEHSRIPSPNIHIVGSSNASSWHSNGGNPRAGINNGNPLATSFNALTFHNTKYCDYPSGAPTSSNPRQTNDVAISSPSKWEMGNSINAGYSRENDLITPLQSLINLKVEEGIVDFQLKDPHHQHKFKSHSSTSNKNVLRPSHTTHPMLQLQSDNISTGSEITWQDWQTTNNSYCTNSISRSPSSSFEGVSEEAQPANAQANVNGNKKTQYHKTKLCPWHRDGKCFMGPACNYAHTRSELRPKPDLSKTKLCPEVVKGKVCDRPGCRFAHDFVELRATSTFFKTRICKFWQRGFCPAGEDCRHAHGKEDLRGYPSQSEEYGSSGGQSSLNTAMSTEIGRPSTGDSVFVPNHIARGAPGLKRPTIQGNVPKPTLSQRAPAATALPSPSFLSTTASTPCAASYAHTQESSPSMNAAANLGVLLHQLAETLPIGKTAKAPGAGPTLNVLKDWISQEVERQWVSRTAHVSCTSSPMEGSKSSPMNFGSPTSQQSFEESMLLPQSVWQGLKGQSPMNRTEWIGNKDIHYEGPDSPNFAEAVRRLLNNPTAVTASPRNPMIPAQFFLEALGEISNVSTAGVWLSERPPVCKAPFS